MDNVLVILVDFCDYSILLADHTAAHRRPMIGSWHDAVSVRPSVCNAVQCGAQGRCVGDW